MANVVVLLLSSYTSRLATSVLLFISVAHTQNTVGKTLLLKTTPDLSRANVTLANLADAKETAS